MSRTYLTSTHVVVAEMVFKKSDEPAADRDHFFNSMQLAGVAAAAAPGMPGMTAPGQMPGMATPPAGAHQPGGALPAAP